MYLLGHIGFVLFLNFISEQFVDFEIRYKKFILALATMTPDLIDKPIGGLLFGQGRWFAHSIIVQTLTMAIVFIYLKTRSLNQDKIGYVAGLYYFGMVMHLVFDLPSLGMTTMFWPLLGPRPPPATDGSYNFLLGFSSPQVIITEIIGLVLLITIGIREKWEQKTWLFLLFFVLTYLSVFTIAYYILVGPVHLLL